MGQGVRWVIHVNIEAVKKDDEGRGRGTHKGERPALLMIAFSGREGGTDSCYESQGRGE